MLLTKLTAAESLLLRKGDEAPFKDLLKYTLMDLLLKQVLMIEDVQRQPSARDPIVNYKYVKAGKNFYQHSTLSHELVFLSIFRKNPGMSMLFRNCVQVGFENGRSQKAFQHLVRSSPSLHQAFYQSLLQRLVGGFFYTEAGFQLRIALDNEVRELEGQLAKLLKENKDQGLEQLKSLGANILLIGGLAPTEFKEFEEAFFREQRQHQSTSTGGGCGTFASYSNDFDGSCPSDGDSGSGGCSSGDGGSSGCGGCGGD